MFHLSTIRTVDSCKSNAFAHNWNSGTIVTAATATSAGKMKYTCSDCGAVEYKTIPVTVSQNCSGHEDTVIEEDTGYSVTFSTDSGATVNVYNTQDYSFVSTANAKTAVSRNSDTGLPDSTGEGQVNFSVVLKSGYEIDDVTVSGGYKNLKDVSTDNNPNTYRVTKVTSDLTITVTTKKTASSALTNNAALSSESITLGSAVTVNAAANGGTGTYTYGVYYKKATSEKWTTVQSYNTNTTVTIKPAAAVTYDICVKVKDSGGTIAKKYFTLTVSNAVLTNKSTLSATTVQKGSSITVTAKAAGGTGSYTYSVYYKKATSEKWTTAQSYGTNTTITIKPAAAVKYNICVKVKDSSGKIVKKYFDITCTK